MVQLAIREPLALVTVALIACSSSVVTPDGDGGGGSTTGGGSSTGGAGGQAEIASCTSMAPAGPAMALNLGSSGLSLSAISKETVYAAHQDIPGARGFVLDAWDTWPPVATETQQFPQQYLYVFAVPGVHGGTSLIGEHFEAPDMPTVDMYFELTEDPSPTPTKVEGWQPSGLYRTANGYLIASGDPQGDLMLTAVDSTGALLWKRTALGCSTHPAVRESPDGSILIAWLGGTEARACGFFTTALQIATLDSSGNGVPLLLEDDGVQLQPTAFLGSDTSLRLAYWRFEETLPGSPADSVVDYGTWSEMPLAPDGHSLGPATTLEMTGLRAAPTSIVPVKGGFVGVGFEPVDGAAEPTHRVVLDLYDDDGALLQEIPTDELTPAFVNGVQAVASPDGRSVLIGWGKILGPPNMKDMVEARLMRFDCVEP